MVSLTHENKRLRAELRARAAELGALRRRFSGAIENERVRIERALHDGTQARLVAVAMALGALDANLPAEPDAAKRIVREAQRSLAVALSELRELSSWIYPPVLTERGLAASLAELADQTMLPTTLDLSVNGRLPIEVEAAAYFVVSELLTNAVKHSHATETRIAVAIESQVLRIEVTDDGIGGADSRRGSGLRGLTNRVEALGGRLVVSSSPGLGTTVRAEIPNR
jgi:signal transduction histidine kinase